MTSSLVCVFFTSDKKSFFAASDLNFLSVLTYAVDHLDVKHVLVTGHYDCGGVRAAMKNRGLGVLDGWLTNIRDVSRLHKAELEAIDDFEQRHRRLVELNVVEQCLNVYKTAVVQRKRLETHGDPDIAFAYPRIHGLVFDPAEGVLKKLPIDYTKQIAELGAIYDLFDWDQDHYMLRKASRLPSRPPRATKE